jgi:putative PIN family toxin of toxin-antitoxin system
LILTSFATWEELSEVLLRQKFSRIRSLGERRELLASYRLLFQPVEVLDFVGDCRDPKDNKFLELALSGNADFIITGDADLLSLHPWRGIAILSPADYLALSE